jgi:hypothetical protein
MSFSEGNSVRKNKLWFTCVGSWQKAKGIPQTTGCLICLCVFPRPHISPRANQEIPCWFPFPSSGLMMQATHLQEIKLPHHKQVTKANQSFQCGFMEVSKKSHQLGREVSLILFTPLPN